MRKRFLTEYTKPDGTFAWSILAEDWNEAKRICKSIKHKLIGLSATRNQIRAAEKSISLSH